MHLADVERGCFLKKLHLSEGKAVWGCSVGLGRRALLCGAHVMQITVLMSTVVQSLALEQGGGRGQVWPWRDSQVVGRGAAKVLLGAGSVRVMRRTSWELYMGVCVSCGRSL